MNSKVLILDLDDTLYARCGFVGDRGENLETAQLLPGAKELMEDKNLKKVLVTKELVPGLQERKIDHFRIRRLLDHIFICPDDQSKKECFRQVKEDFPKAEFWAIGDRRDSEIRWGNELGMTTVLIRRGKYKDLNPRDKSEIPTHEMKDLFELMERLKCRQ